MQSVLRISEAASLGIHAMAMFARNTDRKITNPEIAETFRASEHTLSKVLQRLVKAGLIESRRGPGGGFVIAKPASDIALLEVYEAVEGPLWEASCLLGRPACGGAGCVLGGLQISVHKQVKEYLEKTTLDQLATQVRLGATA